MASRNHSHALFFARQRCILTQTFASSSCNYSYCVEPSLTCVNCSHCNPFVVFKH